MFVDLNEAAHGITAFPHAMPPKPASPGLCQALLERTGQAFFAYDTNSKEFTYLSLVFKALFRMREGGIDFDTLLALVHLEDRHHVVEKLAGLLEGANVHALEFRFQHPDQEEQWVCLMPSLLEESPGRRLIIGHAEDITSSRSYNDNLKKFSNKKNSILNILSHDLAGPLANIGNLSELLHEQMEANDREGARHVIGLIGQSSRKGSALLQEFLSQEFLEASREELLTRRVNLVEKFRETMEEYQGPKGKLIDQHIEFLPASGEIYAEVDDNKFMQAINNLLSNAIKFTPDGGLITVSLEEEGDSVLIKVADTGVGIPEKHHATLFDKFTPARRPGLKGEASTGLGMSIIKTIVEWHRGRIWFESGEGRGTTFYIRIPKG